MAAIMPDQKVLTLLRRGTVIPAHPLALTSQRKLDERRQRALTRYYLAAGAGGVAVGVHTTQFAIREPGVGLFRPVLELAAETVREFDRPVIRIAGICGATKQAVEEAALARELGYDIGLLSLAAMKEAGIEELIAHARAVADVLPIMGFYLQPAVGGRVLPYSFWRRFAEIDNVVAVKIAPFNRYQTLDVIRAVVEAGRAGDVALYTGNDDNILMDLLTPFTFTRAGRPVSVRIVGGLLGHWAVWTKRAVEQLEDIHAITAANQAILPEWLSLAVKITHSNAAFFDAANGFSGCIAGLHEVLRRQGLLDGLWCLDPDEGLSPGQSDEIDRIYRDYPDLSDDAFVAAHLDAWLA
jgi:dihydrodipicolinate synthase/N-acetylneuraminate lyase